MDGDSVYGDLLVSSMPFTHSVALSVCDGEKATRGNYYTVGEGELS